jgi:hypothetical protein
LENKISLADFSEKGGGRGVDTLLSSWDLDLDLDFNCRSEFWVGWMDVVREPGVGSDFIQVEHNNQDCIRLLTYLDALTHRLQDKTIHHPTNPSPLPFFSSLSLSLPDPKTAAAAAAPKKSCNPAQP